MTKIKYLESFSNEPLFLWQETPFVKHNQCGLHSANNWLRHDMECSKCMLQDLLNRDLRKRIYTSISIKYVDWCAKVIMQMQLQYSMHFYQCLHKSSTVRASVVHVLVLSVLLLLACFVISVRLIIPLYSHYRDQAPMEPRLGDHWPMGAQWGQSHTAAWLMAGTQPWRG